VDAISDPVPPRVGARHVQRREGEVGGDDGPGGPLRREGDRETARTGADVERKSSSGQWHGERKLDQMLGLGTRDQDAGVHGEGPAEELALAEQVGDGLSLPPPVEQVPESALGLGRDRVVVPGEDARLVPCQEAAEQQGGLPASGLEAAAAQLLPAFAHELADGGHPSDPSLREPSGRMFARKTDALMICL